jgi:hypothetical protein
MRAIGASLVKRTTDLVLKKTERRQEGGDEKTRLPLILVE